MSKDVVWCNLVKNQYKNADSQPDWVAPPNPKSPEGKKWSIGVKIGNTWYNQAGWNELGEDGSITGITVKMTPPSANEDKPEGKNIGFEKKPKYDNNDEYKF